MRLVHPFTFPEAVGAWNTGGSYISPAYIDGYVHGCGINVAFFSEFLNWFFGFAVSIPFPRCHVVFWDFSLLSTGFFGFKRLWFVPYRFWSCFSQFAIQEIEKIGKIDKIDKIERTNTKGKVDKIDKIDKIDRTDTKGKVDKIR